MSNHDFDPLALMPADLSPRLAGRCRKLARKAGSQYRAAVELKCLGPHRGEAVRHHRMPAVGAESPHLRWDAPGCAESARVAESRKSGRNQRARGRAWRGAVSRPRYAPQPLPAFPPCSEPGCPCQSRRASGGLCPGHWKDADDGRFPGRHARKPCDVPGCQRDHYARGWCQGHYNQARRHGQPGRQNRGGMVRIWRICRGVKPRGWAPGSDPRP